MEPILTSSALIVSQTTCKMIVHNFFTKSDADGNEQSDNCESRELNEEAFQSISLPADCEEYRITEAGSSSDSERQVMVENDLVAANVQYILSEQCLPLKK